MAITYQPFCMAMLQVYIYGVLFTALEKNQRSNIMLSIFHI